MPISLRHCQRCEEFRCFPRLHWAVVRHAAQGIQKGRLGKGGGLWRSKQMSDVSVQGRSYIVRAPIQSHGRQPLIRHTCCFQSSLSLRFAFTAIRCCCNCCYCCLLQRGVRSHNCALRGPARHTPAIRRPRQGPPNHKAIRIGRFCRLFLLNRIYLRPLTSSMTTNPAHWTLSVGGEGGSRKDVLRCCNRGGLSRSARSFGGRRALQGLLREDGSSDGASLPWRRKNERRPVAEAGSRLTATDG